MMRLIVGAGKLDRVIDDAGRWLLEYRQDDGIFYLNHQPSTPFDRVVPEDMAITALINSVRSLQSLKMCLRSIAANARTVDLGILPDKPLEMTDSAERATVAMVIAKVASWNSFAASTATKLLHKKRPNLVPILDNQAIFGAYMYSEWPTKPSLQDSIEQAARIQEALDWIAFDLNRPENRDTWHELRKLEPTRSLIELFDMVWWRYFRFKEDKTGVIVNSA
jgi:hypothetical protein